MAMSRRSQKVTGRKPISKAKIMLLPFGIIPKVPIILGVYRKYRGWKIQYGDLISGGSRVKMNLTAATGGVYCRESKLTRRIGDFLSGLKRGPAGLFSR